MFPIFSPSGEVIGFGGRSVGDEKPKYLNSTDSLLFAKGKTFYGLHETARYIRSEDAAIVVEGYMDFLALYQAGIKNVVATLGTALTPQHAQILGRHTRHIIVLFDGDAAGQVAAERSLPILLQAGLLPRWLKLPNGMDPDDWVNSEPTLSVLTEQLRTAPDLFSALFAGWMQHFENRPTEVVRVVEMVKPILAGVRDPRLKDLYLQEVASALSVSRQWLLQALKENTSTKLTATISSGTTFDPAVVSVPTPTEAAPLFDISRASKAEIALVSFALQNEEYLQQIRDEGLLSLLDDTELQKVLIFIFDLYRQDSQRFDKIMPSLITRLKSPERILATMVAGEGETSTKDEYKQFRDCVKRIQEKFWQKEALNLAQQLKSRPSQENLERFMNIQRQRRQLHIKEVSLKEGPGVQLNDKKFD